MERETESELSQNGRATRRMSSWGWEARELGGVSVGEMRRAKIVAWAWRCVACTCGKREPGDQHALW